MDGSPVVTARRWTKRRAAFFRAGGGPGGAPPAPAHAADLLHGALRAVVLGADEEDDRLDEAEGVFEHESLHLAVVAAAPVRPREERPPYLDFTLLSVVRGEAGRADEAARRGVHDDEGPARLHSPAEELPEDILPVAVARRVLLPYQRV